MATLLRLPDEVLLNVALRLGRKSGDLLHLALTHRRLFPITQEALVRSGCVSFNSIPRYIELLEQNPGWANQIKHIELKNDENDKQDGQSFTPDEGPTRACTRLICALPLDISDQFRDFELEWILQSSPEYWILALLAILPHVTMLTIRSNDGLIDLRYASLLNDYMSTIENTGIELLRIGHDKLKTVNINMDKAPIRGDKISPCRRLVPIRRLRLNHFASVTTCTISGAILSASNRRKPHITYPQDLECLRITCDQDTFPRQDLEAIQEAMVLSKMSFPHLKCIQLFFDQSRRSFVDHMDESRRVPPKEGLWKALSIEAFRQRLAE